MPCVYVEDHRIVGLEPSDPIEVSYGKKIGDEPTGREHPELLKMKPSHGHDGTIVNGISRIGFMSGGKQARWDDETLAATLTGKACDFIQKNKDRPFFLYFATHDIHVPRVPAPQFRGSSGCGVRGDVIPQFDWTGGEVVTTLDRLDLSRNTILIVTSDNGPVLNDGYDDDADQDFKGLNPAGPLRGGKYTIWEGGTRVPWIARWPGRIKAGAKSDALICQVDMLASFRRLQARKMPEGSNWPACQLGRSARPTSCPADAAGLICQVDMLASLLPLPGWSPGAAITTASTSFPPCWATRARASSMRSSTAKTTRQTLRCAKAIGSLCREAAQRPSSTISTRISARRRASPGSILLSSRSRPRS